MNEPGGVPQPIPPPPAPWPQENIPMFNAPITPNAAASERAAKAYSEYQRTLAQANKANADADNLLRSAGRDSASAETANVPLARDLIQLYREIEKEERSKQEQVAEYKYIDDIRTIENQDELGRLIAYTASFAVEDPVALLSDDISKRLYDRAVKNTRNGRLLDWYCSEKMEAHVFEVFSNIRQQWPAAYGTMVDPSPFWNSGPIILTKFARCVADAWRSSSVVSARRYSTTKAIDTLQYSVSSHLRFFKYVRYNPRTRQLEQRSRPTQVPLPRDMY